MSKNTVGNGGMNRRRLLAALGVTVSGGLAGCTSTSDDESDTAPPEDVSETVRTNTATETPTEDPNGLSLLHRLRNGYRLSI